VRRRLAIVGVWILVPLLVLEAVLRLFGPILPGAYRTGTPFEFDPDLGWHHPRDTSLWFKTNEFTVQLRLDADGRRIGPPATGPRVALLGDSFIEAAQVQEDQTLAALLSKALAAQVLNDGVSGYGTDQEVTQLEQRYAAAPPRLAILAFAVANDVWNNDWVLERERTVAARPHVDLDSSGQALVQVPTAPGEPNARDQLRLLLARSAALATLKSGLIPDIPEGTLSHDLRGVLREPAGEWVRAWRITDLLLAHAQDVARSMGVPLLVVIIPDGCQVHLDVCAGDSADATSTKPQDRVAAVARSVGLPVVDLLATFRDHAASGERLYFHVDGHWNARGQEVAAETIARTARELLAGH
jgi:hypothetical protein